MIKSSNATHASVLPLSRSHGSAAELPTRARRTRRRCRPLLYLAGRRKRLGRDDLDAAIAIPQDAQCRDFDPVFPRSAEITSPAGRMTLAGKGKVNPRARIPHPDTKQMVLLIFADLRFPVKDQQPFAVRFPLARQSRLGSGKLTKQQKAVCCEPLLHPYRSTVR